MAELKKEIFNDVWFLYKRHLVDLTEKDWEVILSEEKALLKKHNDDSFLKDLIYAVNNELGRK